MTDRPPTYRVATDTGGTFTDFVIFDETAGTYRIVKIPSTPQHPEQALLDGLAAREDDGMALEGISVFTHGTTVGTNALLEERGARVGLAVTRGFRGVYETMEQSRPFGLSVGIADLITFDMGGTSCDVALVQGGEPTISDQSAVEGRHIGVPMLDIHTVSAGGGTVAVVDQHGSLRVGPQSAGAVPGPAAYGKGGDVATVTDANVVLGYLNPVHLLDGHLAVDAAAAHRVVGVVARGLDVDPVRAADGIIRVVNVKMRQAIRSISTERGFDLRDFTLVAFGGAGPLHACQIALDLGIPRVVVPPAPGATSALGLLMSDVKHDYVRSRLSDVAGLDVEAANGLFDQMVTMATKQLSQEGFEADSVEFRYSLDMRYSRQGYENPVPVRTLPLTAEDVEQYRRDFDAIHEKCHGHAAADQAVEVVNYRVQAIGLVPRVEMPTVPAATGPASAAVVGRRRAYFSAAPDEPTETPVYARARLAAGHRFDGPAIVEQYDSTVVVFPEQAAEVDEYDNLVITQKGSGR